MGAWIASAARRAGGGDAPLHDASRGAARASIESKANRLVEAYADTILRVSYTYLHSTQDAEDICQDVLLKAINRAERFESTEHERAWIIRVAINAAKDLLRRQSGRATVALAVIPTNCLLLCAVYLTSACVTAICRMPLFAILLALLVHIGPLLVYPRAYVAGTSPEIAWASPVVWLMHTCSLNMAGPTFAFGAMVAAGICIASVALMYLVCNRQETCR